MLSDHVPPSNTFLMGKLRAKGFEFLIVGNEKLKIFEIFPEYTNQEEGKKLSLVF